MPKESIRREYKECIDSMWYTIFLIFYIFVSIALVLVVLLQSSKGGGLAGVLGGGGGGSSLFGGRGAADFLTKATTVLAVLFVVLCLVLNALMPTASEDVRSATLREMERRSQQESPAAALPMSDIAPAIPGAGSSSDSSK